MCRLVGRTEKQLLGQPARVLFAAEDDYDALGQKVQAAFLANQPYDGECDSCVPTAHRSGPMCEASRCNGAPVTPWRHLDDF